MNKIRPKQRQWFPAWEMPSDPVKAVWWFLRWLLMIVVRYCWLLIIIAMLLVAYTNGISYGIGSAIVSALVTLLVGLVVWGVLTVVLQVVNVWVNIARAVGDAQRMQEAMFERYSSPYGEREDNVVDSTIVEMPEEEQQQQQQQQDR
ncbi:MAG: hypothetical protein J2P37_14465 [Ktedonobacteraceae bacterium]|nr:hypothetical protein [Ktedonobacteraceae bacterium]